MLVLILICPFDNYQIQFLMKYAGEKMSRILVRISWPFWPVVRDSKIGARVRVSRLQACAEILVIYGIEYRDIDGCLVTVDGHGNLPRREWERRAEERKDALSQKEKTSRRNSFRVSIAMSRLLGMQGG